MRQRNVAKVLGCPNRFPDAASIRQDCLGGAKVARIQTFSPGLAKAQRFALRDDATWINQGFSPCPQPAALSASMDLALASITKQPHSSLPSSGSLWLHLDQLPGIISRTSPIVLHVMQRCSGPRFFSSARCEFAGPTCLSE